MDEQVFRDTLKRIRWSTNRHELAEATRTTLQLMLRRPNDNALLKSLLAQVAAITDGLPAHAASAEQGARLRQAAVRCVVLLQNAKRGRNSRAVDDELRQKRRHHRVMIVVVAAVGTAALYLILLFPRNDSLPGVKIANEIANALEHSRLGLSRHDNVTVRSTHEHIIVTAERLTPEDCVVAAKQVASMGDLAINDTPVGRPNDEKFEKMCRQMNDASLTVTASGYRKK